MNSEERTSQDIIQTYIENCVINNLARAELTSIIETIEHLEHHNMLLGNHYISMALIIRLGSVIENGLREFYMHKKGITSIHTLKTTDKRFNTKGIFQRLTTGNRPNALDMFNEINISLERNELYKRIQEILEHRHLYVHNSGFIDEDYINNILNITNINIREQVKNSGYPTNDVLWTKPLHDIKKHATTVDHFLNTLT